MYRLNASINNAYALAEREGLNVIELKQETKPGLGTRSLTSVAGLGWGGGIRTQASS